MKYKNNAPTENVTDYEKYIKIIKEQVEKNGVNNIALMGPYGSGKSSLMLSYLKKYKPKNCIISLSTFNMRRNKDSDSQKPLRGSSNIEVNSTTNNLMNLVEKSILQQILFSEKPHILKNSKLNRIGNKYIGTKSAIGVCSFISLFFAAVSFWHFHAFEKDYKQLGFMISALISLLFIAILIGLIVYRKLSIKHVKLMDFEAEFESGTTEDTLNKFLDELLYYFSVTKTSMVIIEDLDRFDDLEIFIKLREINQIINRSKIVKQKVTFIYCIKDTMFKYEEERAKFFEFIITIIPILSPKNVKKILSNYNEELELGRKMNNDYLHKISYFVKDYRVLKNTFNDYNLYCDILEIKFSEAIKKENMFSLMLYKNMFPKEFSELQENTGTVANYLKKDNYLQNLINSIEEEIRDKYKLINEIDNQYIDKIDELIVLIKGFTVTYGQKYYSLPSSNKLVNLDKTTSLTLTDDEKYYTYINGYYYIVSFNDIKQKAKNINFDIIKDTLENEKEKLVDKLRIDIEELENKKSLIRTMSFKNLFENNLLKDIIFENDLIRFLLINGYIEENYLDYIVNSSSDVMTDKDRNFISKVLLNEKVDPYYLLDNISNVIDEISEKYFETPYILNLNMINNISNNNKFIDKRNILFNYIKSTKDLDVKIFLFEYFEKFNLNDNLVNYVLIYRKDIIYRFLLNDNKANDIKQEIIFKILSLQIEEVNVYQNFKDFNKIVTKILTITEKNNINILKNIEGIKYLDIKIKDIKGCDRELLNSIKEYNLYEINQENINYIFNNYGLKYGILSIIDTPMYNYLLSNFDKYINSISFVQEIEYENDESLKIIYANKEKIDFKSYIQKIRTKFGYIDSFDNEFVNILFENYCIKDDWNIFNDYYKKYDIKDENLINAIVNNEQLSKTNLNKLEICEWILSKKEINIKKFLASFNEKIIYNNDNLYNQESLITLYEKDLLIFKDFKNIEKYAELVVLMISKNSNIDEILKDIRYDTYLMNEMYRKLGICNFTIRLIEKFKNEFAEDVGANINITYQLLNKFSEDIKILLLKSKRFNYEEIYMIIHSIKNKDKLKNMQILNCIFKDINFELLLNDEERIEPQQEIEKIFKLLREKKVINYVKSTNGKTIRNIKIDI